MFCDYFVTGCRTEKGFSVLLIPRQEGVETSLIKTSYSTAAGTAFVEFNDVKVPVENLLGEEDKGFIVISMYSYFFFSVLFLGGLGWACGMEIQGLPSHPISIAYPFRSRFLFVQG